MNKFLYFKGILMIDCLFSLNFCISLLSRKFDIARNYALFGVKFVTLKFGWGKENDIFHVWG